MSQIQPEQAAFLLQAIYLPSLKNEQGLTARVMAAIPSDKGDYRPDPHAQSAMEIAWHIAVTELTFMNGVIAGEFNLAPNPRPETIRTAADLVAWYSEQFDAALAKLPGLPAEALAKVIDFRGMFQLPAVMYLGFVLSHSVHHRGQLSVYLRPMGSKVPAIYGESYDSAEARKAAAAPPA